VRGQQPGVDVDEHREVHRFETDEITFRSDDHRPGVLGRADESADGPTQVVDNAADPGPQRSVAEL
jgi:hypothetical protein